MNSAMRRHLELQIKTLEIVQRDADKLRRILEAKEREGEFWTISASQLFITTVRRKGSIMIVLDSALLV
jgi:GAF domain-containing protein